MPLEPDSPTSSLAAAAPLPAGQPGSVVVVGTGVVGLATALGCAQRGIPVTLVGPAGAPARAPAPGQFEARIYALSAAAIALLTEQRVWAQVEAQRTCAVERMQIYGDAGGHLRLEARAAGVASLATIVEEDQLLRALWLVCSMTPGIGHVAQDFEGVEFDGGRVRVGLADGTVVDCALLLGADGKRSSVRAAAGFNARISSYGHTAIVANFVAERPHGGTAFQWFSDEGVVALLPLPAGQVSLVWSAPHALAGELQALPPQAFAARVASRSAHALGALAPAGERHAFALDRLVVDRLVRPGLALVGDAAHVVHPLAGQGLNLGLQDVSELLRQLDAREPWRTLGDRVWLRRYERARAAPVGLMRATVDGLARLFGETSPGVGRVRNFGLSAVDALAPLKNLLVRYAQG